MHATSPHTSSHQSDVGKSNRHYSEEEEAVIKQAFSRNNAELQSLQRRVIELKEAIRDQNVALAPHRKLPDDVLSYMFGEFCKHTAHFPRRINNENKHPTIVLCQVCSRWRQVALKTSCLWNDVELDTNRRKFPIEDVEKWLARAGNRPRSLGLSSHRKLTVKVRKGLVQLLSRFPFWKLILSMPIEELETVFAKMPTDAFFNIKHLELRFTGGSFASFKKEVRLPNLSVILLHNAWDMKLLLFSHPWSQLCRLDASQCTVHISLCLEILCGAPLLEYCALRISTDPKYAASNNGVSESTLVSPIQELHLKFVDEAATYPFINLLILPSVLILSLRGIDDSMKLAYPSTRFADLARRSGMSEIKSFIVAGCEEPFNAGAILQSMPSLEVLNIRGVVTFDQEALDGLATGNFGPKLQRIYAIRYQQDQQLREAGSLRRQAAMSNGNCSVFDIRFM